MESIGKQAEKYLADMLAEPLLHDFVFLNPECYEGNKIRELCDVLIEFENIGIPIQLKFQNRDKALPTRDEQKWAKKKLLEAYKQLNGALKSIENNKIWANHKYRGKVEFPPKSLLLKFGIVIVDYNLDSFSIESSLPRRIKNNISIHYFSYNDFIVLCQKLMSLPDLIDYLNQRALIPAWATPKLNGEKDAYAHYIMNKCQFSSTLVLTDFKGEWDRLTTDLKNEFAEKEAEDDKANIFNEILKTLATRDPVVIDNSLSFIDDVTELSDPNRIKVSRILNSVRRIHRREISKKLLEKIEKADKSELGFNYFVQQSDNPEIYFLFLASRHSREKRIEQLFVMADCVNNLLNPKIIIGIATENKSTPDGRSYDSMYLEDIEPSNDQEDIRNCKKFFKKLQVDWLYDFPADKRRRFSI